MKMYMLAQAGAKAVGKMPGLSARLDKLADFHCQFGR